MIQYHPRTMRSIRVINDRIGGEALLGTSTCSSDVWQLFTPQKSVSSRMNSQMDMLGASASAYNDWIDRRSSQQCKVLHLDFSYPLYHSNKSEYYNEALVHSYIAVNMNFRVDG